MADKIVKYRRTGCDLLERPENKRQIEELEGVIQDALKTKLGINIAREAEFPARVIWEVARRCRKKGFFVEVLFNSQIGWTMLVRKPLSQPKTAE